MGEIIIRRAAEEDIPALDRLLYQVHRIHSDARPDLFKPGAKKYTDEQLRGLLAEREATPIFVAVRDGAVVGYAFCIRQQHLGSNNMTDVKTLYIDDLCLDASARGEHIGTQIYRHVLDYARQNGYYNVTLNVWADNQNAVKFYEAIGMSVQKIGMETIL